MSMGKQVLSTNPGSVQLVFPKGQFEAQQHRGISCSATANQKGSLSFALFPIFTALFHSRCCPRFMSLGKLVALMNISRFLAALHSR
jgi:hypothetical protein